MIEYNNNQFKAMGKRIADERKRRKISQEDFLGELSDRGVPIGRNRLSGLEHGNRKDFSLEILIAICAIFEWDLGYVVGEHKEKTQKVSTICKYVGLSEESIVHLHHLVQAAERDGGIYGVSKFGYTISESSLLDDLITSKHFHPLFNAISLYLVYSGALPYDAYGKKQPDLSEDERKRFFEWARGNGRDIVKRQDIADMHIQNACDELKAIYRG